MIIEVQFKEASDLIWEMLGELPKKKQPLYAGKVARIAHKL